MTGRIALDLAQLVTAGAQLEAARAAARAGVLALIAERAGALPGDVPLEERLGWAAKEAAAQALLAGDARPDQAALIGAEAAVTGEAPQALAGRIVARAAVWHAGLARLTGLRRRACRAIAGARTPQQAAAVLAVLRAETAEA